MPRRRSPSGSRSPSRKRSPRSRSRSNSRRRSRSRTPTPKKGLTGVATGWQERGFGFITPDNGGEDIFCHVSAIKDGSCLKEGAKVKYDCFFDDRRGKWRAMNVTGGCDEEDLRRDRRRSRSRSRDRRDRDRDRRRKSRSPSRSRSRSVKKKASRSRS